jgi:hypothetical protein
MVKYIAHAQTSCIDATSSNFGDFGAVCSGITGLTILQSVDLEYILGT